VYAISYNGDLPYEDKRELILNQLLACKRLLQLDETKPD
jgi:hypothetical protein